MIKTNTCVLLLFHVSSFSLFVFLFTQKSLFSLQYFHTYGKKYLPCYEKSWRPRIFTVQHIIGSLAPQYTWCVRVTRGSVHLQFKHIPLSKFHACWMKVVQRSLCLDHMDFPYSVFRGLRAVSTYRQLLTNDNKLCAVNQGVRSFFVLFLSIWIINKLLINFLPLCGNFVVRHYSSLSISLAQRSWKVFFVVRTLLSKFKGMILV